MELRSFAWISVLAAGLGAGVARAAPTVRTFDLVTYTAPEGWKVEPKGQDYVSITRIDGASYCRVTIYASAPALGDLDASFADEWKNVVLISVDPVAAPTPTHSDLGGTPAAMGAARSTAQGRPVFVALVTVEAGASIVSIVVMAPSPEAFKAYAANVDAMLAGLKVRRVDAPPPASPSPPPPPTASGKLIVPPPTRALTVADLAGEWTHDDRVVTDYYSVSTGAYTRSDTIAYGQWWTITAKGGISTSFLGMVNGRVTRDNGAGVVTLSAAGILVVKLKVGPQEKYVVRGWLDGPAMTVLKINGPYYDDVPADILADPDKGYVLDRYWTRKAKVK